MLLQTYPSAFISAVETLIDTLETLDNDRLRLPLSIATDEADGGVMPSSLARELQYNLEHTIHHAALIKIGVLSLVPDAVLPDTFGVAPSTVRYKSQSAGMVEAN